MSMVTGIHCLFFSRFDERISCTGVHFAVDLVWECLALVGRSKVQPTGSDMGLPLVFMFHSASQVRETLR